jgi:hypothetical protein
MGQEARYPKLTIEVPDELATPLARIAAREQKTVQQLAIERLTRLAASETDVGSAAAVLRAMREPPHLDSSDVDELDAAITAGRLSVQTRDLFQS